jgi:hypothetical protein
MNKVLRLQKLRVQSQRLKLLSSQPKIKLSTTSLLNTHFAPVDTS